MNIYRPFVMNAPTVSTPPPEKPIKEQVADFLAPLPQKVNSSSEADRFLETNPKEKFCAWPSASDPESVSIKERGDAPPFRMKFEDFKIYVARQRRS